MATTNPFRPRSRSLQLPRDLGMRVYWVVISLVSIALLGATISVATPRDAMETVEAHASAD